MTPSRPAITLIAALDRERAIGRAGGLLWRQREDQQHFRAATMGHPVIMGRKTWDSLPAKFRPLPGRRNIVVTRNPQWQVEGAEAAASLDAAIDRVAGAEQAFVIGGGELYALALPRADRLLLTEIDARFDAADAWFPALPPETFVEVARDSRSLDDGTRYAFVTYRRKP